MRPPGAPDQLEQRRRRAMRLLQAGRPMSVVARQVQASVSSVWRWWQTYQRAGLRGLRPTPTPGRPPRLSGGQLRTLERILARGPRRAGYPTGFWTLARVAKVIQRQFGIRHHPSHVWETADHSRLAVSAVRDVRGGEADANAHAGAGAAPGGPHPGSLDLRTGG